MRLSKALTSGLMAFILAGEAYTIPQSRAEHKARTQLEEQLIRHEGYKTSRYYDTKGLPHIGVGFNLTRADARKSIVNLGANYELIIDGKQQLAEHQIMHLLKEDIAYATQEARRRVRNYDAQPEAVKNVVVDMIFNLGSSKFGDFKNLIASLEQRDYANAAARMQSSIWYKQVGNRSKYLVSLMRTVKKRV